MAIYSNESFYSTTLASAITATASSISVTTAPNITSGYLVIEANTSNREIILYTGVSGTTLTGCVRGLATYGSDNSAGTGTAHAAGVEIANKDVHYYYAQYYDFLMGTSATGANTMRIGDGNTISASDRLWYVNTSSLSAFWGMSASGQMVVSEDGVTSYVISAGGSGVTAGDGISITAGAVAISRLSASGLRISAGKLAVNPGQGLSATSAAELYVDLKHDYSWTGAHTHTANYSNTATTSARTLDAVSANIEQLTYSTTNVSALIGGVSSSSTLHYHPSNFRTGQASKAKNEVNTQTITHNLGVVPTYVQIHAVAMVGGAEDDGSVSFGTATETGDETATRSQNDISAGFGQDTTHIVSLYDGAGAVATATLASLTSASFGLAWDVNADLGGTRYLQWSVSK